MTVLTDEILVGRDALTAEVLDRVAAARHVLLVGPPGVGKSRLLQSVHSVCSGTTLLLDPRTARRRRRLAVRLRTDAFTVFFLRDTAPLGSLLEETLFVLRDRGRLAIHLQAPAGEALADPDDLLERRLASYDENGLARYRA